MSSRGVIDLRPGRRPRRPPAGAQPLFATRSPQAPKRPMPLRARRRRARAGIALAILLAVAALGYAIHYVSYLPQFNVQTVAVVGTKDVPPRLLSDYVQTILDDGSFHFFSRKNILLYPRAVIERAVVGFFPRIASASVSNSLTSNDLTVTVTEREPFALWCDGETRCYLMDAGGFIFAEAPAAAASSTEYVFRGGIASSSTSSPQASTSPIGQTFIPAHLSGLLALLARLGQSGFAPLGASVENDTDFSVPLQRGYFIKVSFGANADTLVKNLQLVLGPGSLQGDESRLEYIDLRFGDRVYYKLFSGGESTFGGKGQTEATSTPQ